MPIITCGDKKLNIPYSNAESSEYIKDIVNVSKDINVTIPIPDKYCSVIKDYVDYLDNNEVPIITKQRLILNFQLSTLFADDEYFKYCTQQVFNNWSDVCVMVYNDFNDDLRWSFFLHSPYDFIPQYLLDNNTFMTQWNTLNQNVVTKVNRDSAVYYTNIEDDDDDDDDDYGDKVIKTYHTVDGHEVGYKKVMKYYLDNNSIMFEEHYVDGKADGIWRYWYDNDQHTLKSEDHYVDGKADGIWRHWYDNDQHTLKSEQHYVDGKQDGVWREWYDNEQHTLRFERYYVDGKEDGIWRSWFDDDQHTLESEKHYVNGKLDGVWRYWYDNDQHTLKSERNYINGKLDGVWKEWYDNDQHTLKSEHHYVDGKRSELWTVD